MESKKTVTSEEADNRQLSIDDYHSILKRYWGYDGFRGIQQEIIESKFPSAIGKCRPLNAVLKEDMPIAEPAKGSLKDYENCLQSMIPALDKLAEIIE